MGFPEKFVADLRRLKSWPSLEDSPWRQPYLADLTYGELHRLIDEFVTGSNLRILDVGCGTGFLSLELAREGHDVIGIDSDVEAVQVAKRTMDSDPFRDERGSLEYKVADFTAWEEPGDQYDLVIVSRVLHHVSGPARCLSKIRGLLKEGGRLVCVEFAYDRFDRRGATWMHHLRRVLEQPGWYKSDLTRAADVEASASRILDEWFQGYEKEHLNRFEEMRKPLSQLFYEEHFSWKPYLYWDIIQNMRVPSNDTELAIARFVSSMEKVLIDTKAITPVLFCFVGSKTPIP